MNVRKAQKHMQRAAELLNQGQLGFGGPTKRIATTQEQKKQGAASLLESLPSEVYAMIPLECAEKCKMQRVSKDFKKEYAWLCANCSKPYKDAYNGMLRLSSLSNENCEMLSEQHKTTYAAQQKKIMELLQIPAEKQTIDIILKIDTVTEKQGSVRLKCEVLDDVNEHYRNMTRKDDAYGWKGDVLQVEVCNIDTEQEYWSAASTILHSDDGGVQFFCTTHLKWKDIKKLGKKMDLLR